MAEDDYDLMPHREIVKLKKEVAELKKALVDKGANKPATKGAKPKKGADIVVHKDISPSIEKLSKSMDNLLELFKIAGEEIKAEEHHRPHEHLRNMSGNLGDLNAKMDTLIRHNEEIAKGILVVAEMMQEHLPAINDNTKTTRRVVVQQPRPVQRSTQATSPPPSPMFQAEIPPGPPPYMPPKQEMPRPAPKKRGLLF